MKKINTPTDVEAALFLNPPPPKTIAGDSLRQLFDEFGIEGNYASDLAAYYLGYTRQAIQAMMSRTIRRNDYELLRHNLMFWRVQRLAYEEPRQNRAGKIIGEDGRRHRATDWLERQEAKLKKKREDTRKRRAANPLYGRLNRGTGKPRTVNPLTTRERRELIKLRRQAKKP